MESDGNPGTQILFNRDAITLFNLRVEIEQVLPPQLTAGWDDEDAVQALSDELSTNWYWWLLEWLPTSSTNWW
jgi:hypothetical protein